MRWLAIAVVLTSLMTQPPAPTSLWVLQAPDRLVEYDTATFTTRRTLPVPPGVLELSEYLLVNTHGQLLFAAPVPGAAELVWFWDGRAAREWRPDADADTTWQWFLSAGGDALYAMESRHTIGRDRDGIERSIRTRTRLLRSDLFGRDMQPIITFPDLPSCACETGACSETCPVWRGWAPGGIIGDFLLATRFVEGQLQPDYQQSVIYQRQRKSWTLRELPDPIEAALDASTDGRVLVEAVFDAGCCGWINESSDQLAVIKQGQRTLLYDEWVRFGNRNYDGSFVVSSARVDRTATAVAYTIIADVPKAGEEIRLSSDGKPNAGELAQIRKTAAALPAVEIADLNDPAGSPVTIWGAELIGWLDARQILVVEGGRLVVYDREGVKRRDTRIEIRDAAHAFLPALE